MSSGFRMASACREKRYLHLPHTIAMPLLSTAQPIRSVHDPNYRAVPVKSPPALTLTQPSSRWHRAICGEAVPDCGESPFIWPHLAPHAGRGPRRFTELAGLPCTNSESPSLQSRLRLPPMLRAPGRVLSEGL
jgi:hypothetical protein